MSLPDLSSLTVVQIKEWASSRDIKSPTGLKKKDLIEYITGVYNEKQAGIVKNPTTSITNLDVLIPTYCDTSVEWLYHLHKNGWCVAPIPNWDISFTDKMLSWFEAVCPRFNKNNIDTWTASNMPPMLHGILKHYIGHSEFLWQIRELCIPFFTKIWSCTPDDLLCSFDGVCLMPSINKDSLKKSSFKQWIHVDQDRNMKHFACVQGIVNFVDNGPEDGGLILVEGSNTVYSEYMDTHPSEGIVWGSADMDDSLLAKRNLLKICAPPGSIILFDSRTFHCNVHPYGVSNFRMCSYVSMQPRVGASEKELTKRINLYEKGRMTGHWCYGHYFKETPEHPRTYGKDTIKPDHVEIAQLNPIRRRLIGYM